MNTSIINDINKKYNQEFTLIQSRDFNSVYSSEMYIANIFPKWYDLNNYKNNYEKLSQIHSNIPEIISWDNDWNYYIQNKIKNTVDNWSSDNKINNFFSLYLENIFKYHNKNNSYSDLYECLIKKLYWIHTSLNDRKNKLILWKIIKDIQKNKILFQWEKVYYIHWDLSDSNILFAKNIYSIIDFENVSEFDIYYDLVSFDYFSGKNNSIIYKNILSKKQLLFSEKRYEIMTQLFNFIQKNNLWNLI